MCNMEIIDLTASEEKLFENVFLTLNYETQSDVIQQNDMPGKISHQVGHTCIYYMKAKELATRQSPRGDHKNFIALFSVQY